MIPKWIPIQPRALKIAFKGSGEIAPNPTPSIKCPNRICNMIFFLHSTIYDDESLGRLKRICHSAKLEPMEQRPCDGHIFTVIDPSWIAKFIIKPLCDYNRWYMVLFKEKYGGAKAIAKFSATVRISVRAAYFEDILQILEKWGVNPAPLSREQRSGEFENLPLFDHIHTMNVTHVGVTESFILNLPDFLVSLEARKCLLFPALGDITNKGESCLSVFTFLCKMIAVSSIVKNPMCIRFFHQ